MKVDIRKTKKFDREHNDEKENTLQLISNGHESTGLISSKSGQLVFHLTLDNYDIKELHEKINKYVADNNILS